MMNDFTFQIINIDDLTITTPQQAQKTLKRHALTNFEFVQNGIYENPNKLYPALAASQCPPNHKQRTILRLYSSTFAAHFQSILYETTSYTILAMQWSWQDSFAQSFMLSLQIMRENNNIVLAASTRALQVLLTLGFAFTDYNCHVAIVSRLTLDLIFRKQRGLRQA